MLQIIWVFGDFTYNIMRIHNNQRKTEFILFVLLIMFPLVYLKQKVGVEYRDANIRK